MKSPHFRTSQCTYHTYRSGVSRSIAFAVMQFVYLSGASVMAEAFRACSDMEMDCENVTDRNENRGRNCDVEENKKREMAMFVVRGNEVTG